MLYDYASPNKIRFRYVAPVYEMRHVATHGEHSIIAIRLMYEEMQKVIKKNKQRLSQYKKMEEFQLDRVESSMIANYEKIVRNGIEILLHKLEKELIKHPLISNLAQIKGVSAESITKILLEAKNVQRFKTHSQFHIYCGVAPKHGLFPSKWNLETLSLAEKIIYVIENSSLTDHFKIGKVIERIMKENDYKDILNESQYSEIKSIEYEIFRKSFGYNKQVQGMLYFVGINLMIAKGYFYHYYLEKKQEILDSKNEERFYYDEIRGKEYVRYHKITKSKNIFAHKGAFWRMLRLFVSLVYNEWNKYEGIEPVLTYKENYLSDRHMVTLDEVINFV